MDDALKAGRLEDAARLIVAGDLREFLPGKRLTQRIAQAFVERSGQRVLRTADYLGGWRDLNQASQLEGETPDVIGARQELIDLAMDDAQRSLQQGQASRVAGRLNGLIDAGVPEESFGELLALAEGMEEASQKARQGRFQEASRVLNELTRYGTQLPILETRIAEYEEAGMRCRQLTDKMHRALLSENWTETLGLAHQLLELAPDFQIAQDAHRRAWSEVGGDDQRLEVTQQWTPRPAGRQTQAAVALKPMDEKSSTTDGRFVLWVDAVGGFLVCPMDQVRIGQAVPGNRVEIPFQADLSRHHVTLRREGEGYVLVPHQPTFLNGQLLDGPAPLAGEAEIRMGDAVVMRFRQPHALSQSAVLEVVSRHRTTPSVDGVLLMAGSCVLGPSSRNHVVCRDWKDDVVLYRQGEQFFCRSKSSLEIDGVEHQHVGPVHFNSRVVGDDFSMTLEEIS